MRIIKNRTSSQLKTPLRILSILRGRWDGQRSPALQALADLGHEVVYVDKILNLDEYRLLVKKIHFDVAVLWGSSLQNLLSNFEGPLFLDEVRIPYVSLWTDNPIKHLHLLSRVRTPLHKAMFVADTRVIEQLESLGWDNIYYLPPWHIDSDIFKPVKVPDNQIYDISFAATFNPYKAEREKWRDGWNTIMNRDADLIIARNRETHDYVDVFDLIGENWDPTSVEFSKISNAMYFEQKSLAREQMIQVIGDRELHIVGIGSAITDRKNLIMHKGREWNDLSTLFCSSVINLNLTPWPRSCHHRVFQISACRAFCLTDWRDDAVALFEPNKEAVYFKSLEEVPDLIDHYLRYPEERLMIAESGYRRFLSQHTATCRMIELSQILYNLI